MTKDEVMTELKKLGNEQTRKTFVRHGAPADSIFGVRVGDLKVLVKKIKKDHKLALELFATGNSDAMYLAALISDDALFTKKDLQTWADGATWYMISQFSIGWVAAGSPHGWEMGLKWIDSKTEKIAVSGWGTINSLLAIQNDETLDRKLLQRLLDRVVKSIHSQPNRVRYMMNGYVIALGGFVIGFYDKALAAAKKIGTVEVDCGDTDCKVPDAVSYLGKMKERGLGKKRKNAKC